MIKEQSNKQVPLVGIIMGSESDFEIMKNAAIVMNELSIPFEIKVVSAHRTPDRLFDYAKSAYDRGLKVIIAGAGGAAHLPGMAASMTQLPVIGVPIQLKTLEGLDALLSIVQMPGGVPVATVGITNSKNAGLLAARILGIQNDEIYNKMYNRAEDVKQSVVYDLRDKFEALALKNI
ncbi:MAG: 5-(carboxyamino)imidazole ribonucleotide mutase [Clostridiales bacterium]|nr:5-(carboxyamino)imidazole ribonucleotide mutase [Clostridiales bacterium]